MKKIIVTPAGRRRYMEILFNNLIKRRSEFDEWNIWINTEDTKDISYIESLSISNDFIKCVYPSVKVNGNKSIGSFFKNCINDDSIYLRLDDDIVYIDNGAISKIFKARESDENHFLIYGNIINNAVISQKHQQNGFFLHDFGEVSRDCLDEVGWNNPLFAEHVHNVFLNKINEKKVGDMYLNDIVIEDFIRVSINAISWRGLDFLQFQGVVGDEEEQWLSSDKPRQINKPNKIIGDAVFSHFAFFTQRDYLDSTDLLEKYKAISLNNEL